MKEKKTSSDVDDGCLAALEGIQPSLVGGGGGKRGIALSREWRYGCLAFVFMVPCCRGYSCTVSFVACGILMDSTKYTNIPL